MSDADQNVRARIELLHCGEAVQGLFGVFIHGRIGLQEGLRRGFLWVHVLLEPDARTWRDAELRARCLGHMLGQRQVLGRSEDARVVCAVASEEDE